MASMNGSVILVNHVQGYRFKSLKEFLSGGLQAVNVLRGELLIEVNEKNDHFNYQLYRDSSVQLFCTGDDVSPLTHQEFFILEPIRTLGERVNVFENRLDWGLQVDVGSTVDVTIAERSFQHGVKSVVLYKGPIGDHPGIYFGVEILDKKFRTGKIIGTSDGTFQKKLYFTCEDGCGLFVSLSSISPVNELPDSADSRSRNDEKATHSANKLNLTSGPGDNHPPSQFSIGERVTFHDYWGVKHYGTVQWIGRSSDTRTYDYNIVGIHTDEEILNTDYERSVHGLSSHMKSFPERHVLFLPEALVNDHKRGEKLTQLFREKEDLLYRKTTEHQSQIKASVSDLMAELKTKENEIVAKDEAIKANEAEIALQLCELEAREKLIIELRNQIDEFETEIGQMKTEIREKSDEITAKNEEILRIQEDLENEMKKEELVVSAFNWSISRAEISRIPKKQIGIGAWGIVYSARYKGEDVAIKQAHREIFHEANVEMMKREIMIMAHIQHPNLVRFIAAVLDERVDQVRDTPIIISELMDMNLRVAYKQLDLSSSHTSIFCDVAYALHYLHQHRPSIIHRDVSAPNVLLKALPHGGYRAKVSDFGSANLAKQSKTAGAGAIVYCAPEMFPSEDVTKPPQPQTTKVDVFSYGVLLLEVVVREMPTPESRYTLLQRVKGQWNFIYELIVHCMKSPPSDRPTMADILNKLNQSHH